MKETMSFFIRLLETTDASRCQFEEVHKIQAMLNGRISEEEYTAFLMDLYHIVFHFCPIVELAASRCSHEFGEVREYLSRKIVEETGHEKLVLNDLASFSIDGQASVDKPPSYAVQSMLAYNYYACEHIHPCCVVGMLYALELISSVYGSQLAEAISHGLKLPLDAGFTFLDSHSAMDLAHMAELRALLQTIENPSVQQIIINAVEMNFYLFITFLKS
ncbi:MAG: iron-containing redox enzyme family protein [Burkholderiaceae bacterium]